LPSGASRGENLSSSRQLAGRLSSRASRKPSFAQPVTDLKLPGYTPSTKQVLTVQSVLLVLLVLVQLVLLYDVWTLREGMGSGEVEQGSGSPMCWCNRV
jgi:hypothetical protein